MKRAEGDAALLGPDYHLRRRYHVRRRDRKVLQAAGKDDCATLRRSGQAAHALDGTAYGRPHAPFLASLEAGPERSEG